MRRELAAAGRDGTVMGVLTLILARGLDNSAGESTGSVVALSKAFRHAVDRAMAGVPRPPDELTARRRKYLSSE